jgi:2,4-dienoyl-CoA reductase-like NADH-dependent reductase (Old Yellow Enzyme family)
LVITGAQPINPSAFIGRNWRVWEREAIREVRVIVEAVHGERRPVFVQIGHVGVHDTGARSVEDWGLLLSPSGLPSPAYNIAAKALEREEIAEIVEGFAVSAANVREAGADGVEVHAAHGYLLSSFLSPLTNRRTDEYGGSAENRARFVLEVGRAVRARCGDEFVVGLKLNVDEFVGAPAITPELAVETLRIVHGERLFDYFSLSAGNSGIPHHVFPPAAVAEMQSRRMADFGAIAREVVAGEVPVQMNGRVRTIEQAAEIVRAGQADFVGMIRAQIADPEVVRKAQSGRAGEIRRCVLANQGCIKRRKFFGAITCTVNPATGREAEWGTSAEVGVDRARRVLVVGGGPAGMKLAETAAARGHQVTLMEREHELGGQLRYAGRLPEHENWADVVADLSGALERLGVDVQLGIEVAAETVQAFGAEINYLATGATWDESGYSVRRIALERIPRDPGSRVLTPIDAIETPGLCGERVVIVDDVGTYVPLGLAEYLIGLGKQVTLVTSQLTIGEAVGFTGTHELAWVLPRIRRAGTQIFTSTYLDRIAPGLAMLSDVWTQERSEIAADSVVLCMLRHSSNALYHQLRTTDLNIRRIGDCLAPREADDAIFEGHREGHKL